MELFAPCHHPFVSTESLLIFCNCISAILYLYYLHLFHFVFVSAEVLLSFVIVYLPFCISNICTCFILYLYHQKSCYLLSLVCLSHFAPTMVLQNPQLQYNSTFICIIYVLLLHNVSHSFYDGLFPRKPPSTTLDGWFSNGRRGDNGSWSNNNLWTSNHHQAPTKRQLTQSQKNSGSMVALLSGNFLQTSGKFWWWWQQWWRWW